jgi:hypothetical protein
MLKLYAWYGETYSGETNMRQAIDIDLSVLGSRDGVA